MLYIIIKINLERNLIAQHGQKDFFKIISDCKNCLRVRIFKITKYTVHLELNSKLYLHPPDCIKNVNKNQILWLKVIHLFKKYKL